MAQFVFTDILMVALGAMIFLLVRALPRVGEESEEKRSFLDRWAHSGIPERIDVAVNDFLFKFLRRVKVVVLRLDNSVSRHLKNIKKEEASQSPVIDFKEIAAGSSAKRHKSDQDAA